MLRKIISSGIAMSTLNIALAQDSSSISTLSFTGSTDVYYKYDVGKSKANGLTSFTRTHNSFELAMASVKISYAASKVEMVADLGVGKRAQEFSYNEDGISAGIKQLYVSYAPASWLKFTAGSWATHIGYELADAYGNRNYSMSYMFSNGPFFHTGVKAQLSYQANGLMLGIANPADYKYVPEGFINKKAFVAQYSFAPGGFFKAYFNYVGGEYIDTTKTKQYDVVITSTLNPKFSLGYNGTYNRTKTYLGNKIYDEGKSWWGSALYINYDPVSSLGLTLREEYFNDEDGLKIYGPQQVGSRIFSSTLSAQIKVDKLILIPEFRIDKASQPVFFNKNNQPTKTAANLLMAAVCQF